MSTTEYVNVDRALENLEESEIHPENVDAIREFINHCAAEGISDVRQERLLQAMKTVTERFTPDGFRLRGATEKELKQVLAALNRSDYADATKHTKRSAIKKFYKVMNGGHEHPEKVDFFTVGGGQTTNVTREDLFTEDELNRLFRGFQNVRDRALIMMLYESAARPGELLSCNIADFSSNEKGDFISLQGSKGTPDRTNQLVRAGRTVREWLAQHPFGGSIGDIDDPSAPLWVKTQRHSCQHCGEVPRCHDDTQCDYEADIRERVKYQAFLQRFKRACERADIPENKRQPYKLRHTRLTEVATFMGYEQLNKFAGWKPGSDRAKIYVHLNNDDVNQAIRDQYGLTTDTEENQRVSCPFCDTQNQSGHSECRTCGRPLTLEQGVQEEKDEAVIERLKELVEKGAFDDLDRPEVAN
jgi:integrase